MNRNELLVDKLKKAGLTDADIDFFAQNQYFADILAGHLRKIVTIVRDCTVEIERNLGLDSTEVSDLTVIPEQVETDPEQLEERQAVEQLKEEVDEPKNSFNIDSRRVFGLLRRRYVVKAAKEFIESGLEPTLEAMAKHLNVEEELLLNFAEKHTLVDRDVDGAVFIKRRSANRRITYTLKLLNDLIASVKADLGYFDQDEAANRLGVDVTTIKSYMKKFRIKI